MGLVGGNSQKGVEVWGEWGGHTYHSGDVIDLYTKNLGPNTMVLHAVDKAYNESIMIVNFNIIATIPSTITGTSADRLPLAV